MKATFSENTFEMKSERKAGEQFTSGFAKTPIPAKHWFIQTYRKSIKHQR
jgi:hypothetical protein